MFTFLLYRDLITNEFQAVGKIFEFQIMKVVFFQHFLLVCSILLRLCISKYNELVLGTTWYYAYSYSYCYYQKL